MAGAPADLGQGIEHEHDVGVTLSVMLGHVQPTQTERRAPVDLLDAIAWGEFANITGLDALAEFTGHVVADRCLRPARAGEGPQGQYPRVDPHAMRLAVRLLPGSEAQTVPGADETGAELEPTPRSATNLVAPLRRFTSPEGEYGPVTCGHQGRFGGKRLDQLHQGDRRAGGDGHCHGHTVALEGTVPRDRVDQGIVGN